MRTLRSLEHWLGQRLSLLGPRRRAAHREVRARALGPEALAELGRPAALFDLRGVRLDRDRGRDAHRLVSLFRDAGHVPAFVDRYALVSSLGTTEYKRLLLDEPFALVGGPDELPPGSLVIADHGGVSPTPSVRVLRLHHGPGVVDPRQGLAVPYGPHPLVARRSRLPDEAELLSRRRRWRLFFAGNAKIGSYARSDLGARFGKLSRVEVLTTLTETLPDERRRTIDDAATLAELGRESPFAGFALIDFGSLYVPEDRWLETLADAELFLACPGVRMPTCHNVIEAMSVGTVPLLEHPEHFHPALRDGVNCLAFDGRAGLKRRLAEALELSPETIAELRRGVLTYHREHLTAEGFARKLAAAPDPLTLHVDGHLTPAARP
ncbi:MAG: hypothetical protein AAF533_23650 [Acidobacteriota bacterium]